MDNASLIVWGKLLLSSALTYFVYKDSERRNTPYRNAWIVFTFIFFPVVLLYLYYVYYRLKQDSRSNLFHREMEMRKKLEEQQIKLRAERRAWEKARREEMALNKITEDDLEKARQKRAEDKARRMQELAQERALQEEAAKKQLHLK